MRGRDDVRARDAWLRQNGPDPGAAAVRGGIEAREAAHSARSSDGFEEDLPGPSADWVSLGPTVATGGMASDRPGITGRVRSIAHAPGGQRAYAATAGGGVWMTLDTGETWVPLDPWTDTPNASLVSDSGGLAIGALGVRFGATTNDDAVFVGMGEPRKTLGVSIRRFGLQPLGATRQWTDEATNLGRFFSYRILVPPPSSTTGNPDRVWAATSSGLFERPAAAPFAAWTLIPLPAPFSTAVAATPRVGDVTDVVLLFDGANEWLYAAVWGRGVVRIQLAGGSAVGQPVTPCRGITESMTAADRAKLTRISLAASEDGASRVYALCAVERGTQRARLFRLAPTATNLTFQRVSGVPPKLWFVNGGDQGDYDNTVAIVPQPRPAPATATDELVVGGSTQNLDNDWQAAVHRGHVRRVAGVWTFSPTAIGRGAHADVHCAAFPRFTDRSQDRDDLWLGTDGGIYRSQPSVENGRFQPSHAGIAAVQLTYLAQHPVVPAFLLAGSQDNGLLIHTGEPTWRRHTWAGDAGGVAVHPSMPRWMWQYTKGSLYAQAPPGVTTPPPAVAFPPTSNAAKKKAESKKVSFYLRLAAVEVPAVAPNPHRGARLAFASHRVWVSNDWGATWRSLPSNTNPLTGAPVTRNQLDGQSVTGLAWASPSVLFAATSRGVYQFTGVGTAAVTATVLARRDNTANRGLRRPGEPANAVPPAVGTTNAVGVGALPAAIGPLPADFLPSALAAEDPAGTRLYLGAFSQTSNEPLFYQRSGPTAWVPCLLGAFLGGRTRVRAIVVDPANPQDVYVGTDVGVYRGIRTDNGAAPPTWTWSNFSFGLPEAAAYDLALWAPPGAGIRLLRVATFGRGAWEIDLERATGRNATPPREPEVYLRVCDTDDGRRVPGVTRLTSPLDPARPHPIFPAIPNPPPPPRPVGFVESPDIAVVRARARVVRPWPSGALTGADRQAWRRAAATWGHRLTPGTGAFATADRLAWQAIQRERLIPVTTSLNERTWRTTFKGLDTDPDHLRYVDRYGRELAPPPATAPPAGSVAPPRWQVADPAVNRVLVHVRSRGPLPVAAGRTSVVVIWQVVAPVSPIPALGAAPALPNPGVVLPALPARWREGVRTSNLALLRTDGWVVAGAGLVSIDPPVTTPPPHDPENPRVVGIDLDLTGRTFGDLVALFAVVRCQDDLLPGPADPAATDPLRNVATVVTTESRTALRVLQVRDPAT